ncbi:hypothetical protein AVEN_17506-1 [Araneus ventricosus]|uniref:DUF4817 domain-containing protein n=1 Tax=Araneus ventricosus TaxID=182803 RepID=A0A4Y1ZUU1_ARAVE|nr:hypothetical protein AVEN_17506-1 [Araneus ventricosus]
MGNSERQCQNGYRAAEDTSLVPRSKSIVAVQRRFRLEYRNTRSPNKNSLSIGMCNLGVKVSLFFQLRLRPTVITFPVPLNCLYQWGSYLETDNFKPLGENIFELLQLIRGIRDVPDSPSAAW